MELQEDRDVDQSRAHSKPEVAPQKSWRELLSLAAAKKIKRGWFSEQTEQFVGERTFGGTCSGCNSS